MGNEFLASANGEDGRQRGVNIGRVKEVNIVWGQKKVHTATIYAF